MSASLRIGNPFTFWLCRILAILGRRLPSMSARVSPPTMPPSISTTPRSFSFPNLRQALRSAADLPLETCTMHVCGLMQSCESNGLCHAGHRGPDPQRSGAGQVHVGPPWLQRRQIPSPGQHPCLQRTLRGLPLRIYLMLTPCKRLEPSFHPIAADKYIFVCVSQVSHSLCMMC